MTLKTLKHFTFDLSRKLGGGSTGTVYLGTDLKTNQPIAVKAIELKNIDNEVTQYLLKNEIKALKLTNHPNVLKAIDVIQQPEFVYIITDYLPGGTLAEYIEKTGFINEAEALHIFKQLVEGYDHIFDLQIYHRDLKPHNILFDSNFRPVLSDFGYCEITGFLPKPKLQYNVGSPGFMAPESIVGNLYSENSQVWSLGAILYEMMTGRNYTNGKPVMEAVMLIKKQGPYYPDHCSELTKTIIRECMMLKPENRMKVKTLKQLLHEKIQQRMLVQNHEQIKVQAQAISNQQAVFLAGNGQPMILNVNPNQYIPNNPALNPQPLISQVFPEQIPQAIPLIPLISGVKQTNVVTLSKFPSQNVQPPSELPQLNSQVLRGSSMVHPNSMPDVHSGIQQQNIIRNISPRRKVTKDQLVGKIQEDVKLTISQPSPLALANPIAAAQNTLIQHQRIQSLIQPHSQPNMIDPSFHDEPHSAPVYIPDDSLNNGYAVMSSNPFLQNQVQAQQVQVQQMHEEQVQSVREEPMVQIPQVQAPVDVQKLQMQQQINQQMYLLQQQAIQQQALQQQLFQQNQLITMQQQALQQQVLQQQALQQSAQLQTLDPKLQMVMSNQLNQLNQGHHNLPNTRVSQLAPGIITPIVQFTPQLNSQLNQQIPPQFPPQIQFDMSQQINSMNHIPIIPPQLQYSQTPSNFQHNIPQIIPQQQSFIPGQQMVLPNGVFSQTSLNTSFQNNQGKQNGVQPQVPQMFVHPPQFGPQFQNVVGPNFYNYYGA